ncbi:MAG: hypothetical protein NZ761_11545 [Dehalococcoidia bacterium]|jgi:hypothetical protein|nr:hypothetical protein [Dehalococcoidia bacterium]
MTMEFDYERSDAWATLLRLASSVARLKVVSNLKAAGEAHQQAFLAAGRACSIFAEASLKEGGAQAGALREARSAVAHCRAWLQVMLAVANEPESTVGAELALTEQVSRQLEAMIRLAERGQRTGGRQPAPARSAPAPARGGRP